MSTKQCSLAVVVLMLLAATGQAHAGQTFALQSKCQVGSISRIVADLEVGGNLKVAGQDKVQTLPMSVVAKLAYDEKILGLGGLSAEGRRSIRHYDQPSAVIKIDKAVLKPTLRDDRRTIAAELKEKACTLFSPMGPLTREELDLIEVVGNSMLVESLLPAEPVEISKPWQHDNTVLAALLCLDAISHSEVESTLTEVVDGVAKISMAGTLNGAVGGVATEIQLKARYNFDMNSGRVNWFAISIKENRSVGHVGPGLDIVAKLRMQITPDVASELLSEKELSGLPLDLETAGTLLRYESSKSGFGMHHDRRWYFTRDNPDLAVLRLVDRGELVAQCNLSPLKNLKPGERMTLAEFQADVERALGKGFGQFLQASESTNAQGQHVLRVIATGIVAELPIQWNYYLVTSPDGQRVAFAFTLEQNLVERFAEADQSLVDSVEFGSTEQAAAKAGVTKR